MRDLGTGKCDIGDQFQHIATTQSAASPAMHAIISGHMHYTCRYSTISEIAVKSRDHMKGTAATDRFTHACLSPPIPLLSSVSSSINLIVVLPWLMVTSSRLLSTAEALALHIWWAWRGKSKWPPALWWKPMQLECNRGSSIIQRPQKKTEQAAFSLEPHSTRMRAVLQRLPGTSLSLTSLKCKKKNKE